MSRTQHTPAEIRKAATKVERTVDGTCNQIVTMYKQGFGRSEIIAAGFNSHTVHRQVHEFELEREAKRAARSSKSPAAHATRKH